MGKFFPNSLSWGGPADGSAALHHFGVMTQAQIDAFTPAASPARVYNSDRDLEQDWNGATWENVNAAPEPVQVLSSANNGQTIAPGFYDINADAAFAVTLEAPLGQYQFANSRLNLSAANAVTINGNTPATDTFTDNAGAQVLGPLVLDIAGYGFRLVAESATDWHIVDAVILPPGSAKDRVFLSDTAVGPNFEKHPTLAEIATATAGAANTLFYYTGTDTATDAPTHVYLTDNSGAVTLIDQDGFELVNAASGHGVLAVGGGKYHVDPTGVVGSTNFILSTSANVGDIVEIFQVGGTTEQIRFSVGSGDTLNGVLDDTMFVSRLNGHWRATRVTGGWIVVDMNAPTAQQWVFSADNMTAADGDQIIVQSGHTINLPANPTGPDEILFVAANGDWETIGATFNTTDAFTIGAGQADIVVGADTVRMIAIAGNTNWLVASGGETAPPQDESYNAEADLPLASTVPPGRRAIVTNDADTSRIGVYVATGAVGAASASQWIKS